MATPSENEDKRPEQEGLSQVSLRWLSAEDVQTVYANQVIVSHSGPEFYLVFGEVLTPSITGDPFAKTNPTELAVKPVAKIAIAHGAMLEIAKLINSNVERFLKIAMMIEQSTEKKDE